MQGTAVGVLLGYFRNIFSSFLYFFQLPPPRSNSWALWPFQGQCFVKNIVIVRGRSCPKAEKRLGGFWVFWKGLPREIWNPHPWRCSLAVPEVRKHSEAKCLSQCLISFLPLQGKSLFFYFPLTLQRLQIHKIIPHLVEKDREEKGKQESGEKARD